MRRRAGTTATYSHKRWASVLDELETERAGAAAEVGRIEQAISALRQLANGPAPAPNGRRPARRTKARKTRTTTRRKPVQKEARARRARTARQDPRVDQDLLVRAKALFDQGKPIAEIAAELKTTATRLYGWKYRYGWGKPGAAPAARQAAPEPPDGFTSTPRRRCSNDDCGKVTATDPCHHCGEKWKNHK